MPSIISFLKRFGLATHFNLVSIKPAEKDEGRQTPNLNIGLIPYLILKILLFGGETTIINIPHKNISSEDNDKIVSFYVQLKWCPPPPAPSSHSFQIVAPLLVEYEESRVSQF